VVDEKTGIPVEFASIYFANTTTGTYSDKNGDFKLTFSNEGLLNLVVSHVSYETFSMNIATGEKDIINVFIKLKIQTYEFKSVSIIEKDPNKRKRLETFTRILIGQTKNSLNCKVENPWVLHLENTNSDTSQFGDRMNIIADSTLIIKNEALGYTIKYNLIYFGFKGSRIAFFGYPLFEDLIDSSKNPRYISARRNLAYLGSKLHFFRALYSDRLREEGFEIYRTMIVPIDSVAKYGLLGDSAFSGSSAARITQTSMLLNLNRYLTYDPLTRCKRIVYNEPIEIRYVGRGEEKRYDELTFYFKGLKRTKYVQPTIVKFNSGNIEFYSNGSIIKPDELITIGYWSYKQMADLLPFNFFPVQL
jgi:hypothetical protein